MSAMNTRLRPAKKGRGMPAVTELRKGSTSTSGDSVDAFCTAEDKRKNIY